MLVVGFFVRRLAGHGAARRPGSCSASLAGLELSIREHFGGYRSHTLLLAAAAAVATLALFFYALPDAAPAGGAAGRGRGRRRARRDSGSRRAFRARSGRTVKLR